MIKPKQHFLFWHGLAPSVITLLIFLLIRFWQLDEQLAALFYDGTEWPYKNNWWLSAVIHDAGHKLALAAYALLIVYWLVGRLKGASPKGIAYAITAIGISVISINLGKNLLHYPCPWQATSTGLNLFAPYLWRPEVAGCFPSGHASSGYAWVCFYYVAYQYYPARRFQFLAVALAVGLVFGLAQQMRGAHFISHDLVCIYLCWMVASVVFYLWPSATQKYNPL